MTATLNAQEIISLEQENVLGVYGRPDIVFERGEGNTLYDTEGNAYTDCVSGIAVNALGYNDPGINQAIQEVTSTGVLHLSNLYHSAPHAQLAELICSTCFATKVHFCLCGASANEGAMKFARRVAFNKGKQDKYEVLAFTNAFHGRLFGSLSATPRPQYQEAFQPLMPGTRFAEFNDLESAKAEMTENVAAILVEPIQGEGGIHPASKEFLAGLRALADEYDAMLIYDEVQCGVGRTGQMWGHQTICGDPATCADCDCGQQTCAIAPDIMTTAKPLAGGLPIGAIMMNEKVAGEIKKGDHASTFAGNPFTTHVAHHVVSRIKEPEFLADVTEKGDYLVELLEELNSPHIKEIRGKGLLVGVEMDVEVGPIVNAAYDKGVILVSAGADVLRFVPPLTITKEELEKSVTAVGEILQEM